MKTLTAPAPSNVTRPNSTVLARHSTSPLLALRDGAGSFLNAIAGSITTRLTRLDWPRHTTHADLRRALARQIQRVPQHVESALPRRFEAQDVNRLAGFELRHWDANDFNTMVATPLWDLMDRDGARRWQALPGLLMIGAFGIDPKPYEKLMCVTTELLRCGAEIMDDIGDDATLRRGEESIHLRYGIDAALSAANAAFFIPAALLAEYPCLDGTRRQELFGITTGCCMRTNIGGGDTEPAAGAAGDCAVLPWLTEDLEQQVMRHYETREATSCLVALECAAVIAETDSSTTAACTEFGRVLGVTARIVNDLANFSILQLQRGSAGTDLGSGRRTLVLASALRLLSDARRRRLAEILASGEATLNLALRSEGILLVRESGALESCRTMAREMLADAWKKFAPVMPNSESKTMLSMLLAAVLNLGDDVPDTAFFTV